MHFIARASSEEDYHRWVESAKKSSRGLDVGAYNQLAVPSENNPVETLPVERKGDVQSSPHEIYAPSRRNETAMFGRLTLEAFKHEASQNVAVIMMLLTGIGIMGILTYFKRWKWLWNEWLTTVDPKRIGIMYIIVALLMFFKGFADALMMRLQQALSVGDSHGFISSGHFQEVFSAHGTTMIFFVGMGIVFGLLNLVVPLQIGARDVAYPFLNALGFWLFAAGCILDSRLACHRQIFCSGMAGVSSSVRNRVQPR